MTPSAHTSHRRPAPLACCRAATAGVIALFAVVLATGDRAAATADGRAFDEGGGVVSIDTAPSNGRACSAALSAPAVEGDDGPLVIGSTCDQPGHPRGYESVVESVCARVRGAIRASRRCRSPPATS